MTSNCLGTVFDDVDGVDGIDSEDEDYNDGEGPRIGKTSDGVDGIDDIDGVDGEDENHDDAEGTRSRKTTDRLCTLADVIDGVDGIDAVNDGIDGIDGVDDGIDGDSEDGGQDDGRRWGRGYKDAQRRIQSRWPFRRGETGEGPGGDDLSTLVMWIRNHQRAEHTSTPMTSTPTDPTDVILEVAARRLR